MTNRSFLLVMLGAVTAFVGVGIGYFLGQSKGGKPAAPAARPHAANFSQIQRFHVGSRNVKAMVADGPIVWAGTSEGIIRHDRRTNGHTIFNNKNSGLISNGIFFLDKLDERLWAGTYGGGLSIFDGESWTNYNLPEGLADAFVYSVTRAPNGDIWIATWSGANHIVGGNMDDRAAWKTYTVENTSGGLPNLIVTHKCALDTGTTVAREFL